MSWYTEGEKVNPADGRVLADTGVVDTGNNMDATLILSSTVAARVVIQHRAAGGRGKEQQVLRIPANITTIVPLGRQSLDPGDRMRVIQSGALVGLIQVSIIY